jgi:hypothetical protein
MTGISDCDHKFGQQMPLFKSYARIRVHKKYIRLLLHLTCTILSLENFLRKSAVSGSSSDRRTYAPEPTCLVPQAVAQSQNVADLERNLSALFNFSAFPLVNYLTHHERWMIVLHALQLTRAFAPRNAPTIEFDRAVLLARGASLDVTTATLVFKVIGKLIARRHTAVR